MAQILEYLVWISLLSVSIKCPFCHPQTSSDQYGSEEHSRRHGLDHHRMLERSAVGSGERVNERTSLFHNEPRRIQDQGRRRGQSKVDSPRIENGTLKILNYPSAASRRGATVESYSDRVIFPGPTSGTLQDYVPDISEECKKKGICEKVPNYPQEYVNKVIDQLGESLNKFRIQEMDWADTPDITQRLGEPEENYELCTYKEQFVVPLSAPGKHGEWYFVVNNVDKPIQGFMAEYCSNVSSPCSVVVRDNYVGYCLQKFVYRSILALDRNGKPIELSIKMPSCCTCVARILRT